MMVRGLIFAVLVYLACWTMIYGLIMEGDFDYFFRYFYLAWSRPGELPALIQLYTVIATLGICLLAGVVVTVIRWRRKTRI